MDRVQDQGNGRVRYWYSDDGDALPERDITVTQQAGQIANLAGNVIQEHRDVFTIDVRAPSGMLVTPSPGATIDTDPGYVEIQ